MFSPEWANSAQLAESRTIYEHMYTHIAPQWLAQGASTHLISLMAHDQTAIEAWQWLGFGYLAVDGVRNLNPIAHCAPGIQIRQAYIEDLDALLDLDTALVRYLAGAPTYLAGADPEDPASLRAWLTDPDRVIWLACRDAERLAFLRIGPSSEGACALIQDKDTTSITGAFTVEHARGSGIATALLDRALGWARDNGYARCAVDFEPMNTLAARFWLRHFAPVSFALTRHIDRP
jgi:GNAT superfamily N-acetyltransferase